MMTAAAQWIDEGRRDRWLATFTLARLLLVPAMAVTFMVDPAVTTAFLIAYMFADLLDGVVARRLSADGVQRVVLDSIVDRIAIDACLVAAWLVGALPGVLLVGFLARDVYLMVICRRMVREHGVAIKADIIYRGLSFTIAVWAAMAPFVSQPVRTVFATVILAAALGVAADLSRLVRAVRNAPLSLHDRVVPAYVLRRSLASVATQEVRPALVPAVTTAS